MTESLRLIIAEMVHDQAESGKDITVDTMLLKLAEKGLASFIRVQRGKMTWVASPNLIKSINGGLPGRDTSHPANVVIDDTLETILSGLPIIAKRMFGMNLDNRGKRVAVIEKLLDLEIDGEAIAYKDDDGQIAWKASGKLQRLFEEELAIE